MLSAGIRFGNFHWPITGYPAIPTPTAQTGAVRGVVKKNPPHPVPTYDARGAITAPQRQGGPATLPSTIGTFAELPSTDDQAIGFTGYVKDSQTGLYYAKARYYDPRIARFTTQDPEEGNAMQPRACIGTSMPPRGMSRSRSYELSARQVEAKQSARVTTSST